MGSIFKKAKRFVKKVTKPVSKVFKGVAKGIARVGKSVMKGVAKLQKKLGPLGMIALAVAMPYALQGLGTAIGHGGMAAGQASGWMGSQNVFLRSIGNVGNAIRTGYSNATGAIGRTFGNITKSISEGFSKFTKGTGNIWKDISQGAKNLYNGAKSTVNNFRKTLKFPGKDLGTVKVKGWGGPFDYMQGNVSQMTSEQAAGLLQIGEQGAIQGAQLSSQTLGSQYDKLISDTINSTFDKSGWDSGTIRRFSDAKKFTQANNTYVNDYDLFKGLNNQGQTYHAPTKSWTTDLSKTGDYKIGTTAPGTPTEYSFTGDKSFNNPVAKKFNLKKVIKKGYTIAKAAKSSLLQKQDIMEPEKHDWFATSGAQFADSSGAALSATDIKGATGSSKYAQVFGDAAWHKLKSYHKNMNYLGST